MMLWEHTHKKKLAVFQTHTKQRSTCTTSSKPEAEAVKNFIQTLLDHNQDEEVLKEMAYILHMVTGDAAISSVVPFPSHEVITMACISLKFHNILNEENLNEVRMFNKQIPRLLYLAQMNDCVDIVTSFILELIDMTVKVHQDDHIFTPPSPICRTYNHPSGTAYYFSPTGEQLRSMPDLQVNKTSTKKNYDDNPLIDGYCNKRYPSVSYGGYGYMFIWFFPIHGHTYKFHLIDGMVLKAGKIHFVLFSSTKNKCQITYFMTLPAHYLSIA